MYQTHTFSNNLNDREIVASHLMFELRCKTTFYDIWRLFQTPIFQH